MEGTSADRDDLRKMRCDPPPRLVIGRGGTAATREQYKLWAWAYERYAGQRGAIWVLEPEAVDKDTRYACQSRGVTTPSSPSSSAETEAAATSPQQQHLYAMRVAEASVSNQAAACAWLYDKLADALLGTDTSGALKINEELYGLFRRCEVGDGAVIWQTLKRRYGGELSTAGQYQLVVALMTYKQGDFSFDMFVQEIERKRDTTTSSGAEVNDDVTKGVLFNDIKITLGAPPGRPGAHQHHHRRLRQAGVQRDARQV
jgi:hypothetical protein